MNLPKEKVKLVLVDRHISDSAKKTLNLLNIDFIETLKVSGISDCTATHPDMQFVKFAPGSALVEKSVFDYYKKMLPAFDLIPIDGIQTSYPYDSVLNVTLINDRCFLTEFQNSLIGGYFKAQKIFINQGYGKCNICILNENAIITSDCGVIKKAENFGIRAYFLPDREIFLKDYKNGFWGGCTGLIDCDLLYINGNIKKMSCYCELLKILEKEKIEPIYHKEDIVTDNGSIIPII